MRLLFAALLLWSLSCQADDQLQIVPVGKQYVLQHGGKPLTGERYDQLVHDARESPDFVLARRGTSWGVLDADSGKLLIPVRYDRINPLPYYLIGLVGVGLDNKAGFVDRNGRIVVPLRYDAIGPVSGYYRQAFAKRQGQLFSLHFADGQLQREEAAPDFYPYVVVPPSLRAQPQRVAGLHNGTYVADRYPDLYVAWQGWRRGELRDIGQPAIVLRGDTAYVSFGLINGDLPLMPNTMQACQSEAGVSLWAERDAAHCDGPQQEALLFLKRDADGALVCADCHAALPQRWIALDEQPTRFAGIGVVLQRGAERALEVREVLSGGPAAAAGVAAGDIVTGIDGRSSADLTVEAASQLIRGKVDTPLSLTLMRAGQPLTLNIIRRPITIGADGTAQPSTDSKAAK
ncbi:WG repeat-containing protein [Chitinolyticbacter meiyuanensis]|uniref:WG repeat-containing protein n=1 Tax=Chitinolyticbacter meiyuanensis TaxID=682798 RepID=UPI0011E5ECCA|nr:WG repeat-containing protein [Chitinolyticbacter meiyuanensis]